MAYQHTNTKLKIYFKTDINNKNIFRNSHLTLSKRIFLFRKEQIFHFVSQSTVSRKLALRNANLVLFTMKRLL